MLNSTPSGPFHSHRLPALSPRLGSIDARDFVAGSSPPSAAACSSRTAPRTACRCSWECLPPALSPGECLDGRAKRHTVPATGQPLSGAVERVQKVGRTVQPRLCHPGERGGRGDQAFKVARVVNLAEGCPALPISLRFLRPRCAMDRSKVLAEQT